MTPAETTLLDDGLRESARSPMNSIAKPVDVEAATIAPHMDNIVTSRKPSEFPLAAELLTVGLDATGVITNSPATALEVLIMKLAVGKVVEFRDEYAEALVATMNNFCVASTLTVNDEVLTVEPAKLLAVTFKPIDDAMPESEGWVMLRKV